MGKLTLKSNIRDLELAARDYSCLSKAGYDTIGDIVSSTYEKLLNIKNIKPDRLDSILDNICSFGFSIKGYNKKTNIKAINIDVEPKKTETPMPVYPVDMGIVRAKEYNYSNYVNVQAKKERDIICIPCGVGNTDFGFRIFGITEVDRCEHPYANIYALTYNYLIRSSTINPKELPRFFRNQNQAFSLDYKRVFRLAIIILQMIKNNKISGSSVSMIYSGADREAYSAVELINSYACLFSKLAKVRYTPLKLVSANSGINISLDEKSDIYIEELQEILFARELWFGARINYALDHESLENLEYILAEISPYTSFKEGQFKAICDMMNSSDHSVCIMPTGSGKSLVFYFASLLQPLPIFVISPTDILIDDQIRNLWQIHKMDSVSHLKLTKENDFSTFHLSANINYLTPATFQNRNLLVAFRSINNGKQVKRGIEKRYADGPLLSYIVLDEIHCISNWGHDFRPEYLMLSKFLRKFLDQTTFLGFTATANYTIVSDIQKQLDIKQEKIFSPIPFEKANISYNFIELATPKDMMQKAKEIVDELIRRNQRTIIFTKNDDYSILLSDAIGDEAALFVSDYPTGYQSFANGKCKVLIASEELGVGINLPNVRNVIHFGLPVSKSEYVQEIGRAGRAEEAVTSYVLYLNVNSNAPEGFLKRTTDGGSTKDIVFEKKNDYYDCYLKFNNGITSKSELSSRITRVFDNLYANKRPLYVKTYKEKSYDWFTDVETQKRYIYMLNNLGYVDDWYSYSGNDEEGTVDIMIVVSSTNHDHFAKDTNMIMRMKERAIAHYEFLGNNRSQIMATQSAKTFKELIGVYIDWYYNRYLYLHKEMFLDSLDFVVLYKDRSDEQITDAIREYFSLPFAEIKNTEAYYATLSVEDVIKKVSEGIGKSTLANIERINSNNYVLQLDVLLLLGNAMVSKFFDCNRFERIIREIGNWEKQKLIEAICAMYPKFERESRFDVIRTFNHQSNEIGKPIDELIALCYKEYPKDEIFYGFVAEKLNMIYFANGGK